MKRLAEFDIAPAKESIAKYLQSLRPSPEERKLLEDWVAQLGSEQFEQREAAARQLLRRPAGATEILTRATRGDDFEIRWRSKQILEKNEAESASLLRAVFTTIEKEKLTGLAQPLIGVIPFCQDDYLIEALRRAVVATSQADDAPFLKEQLHHADPGVRVTALRAAAKVLGKEADAAAVALLTDGDQKVQAAAARVLADHGRREALPALVALLEASDARLRNDASRMLRAFTGKHFDFTFYDASEKRAAAVETWKKWIAGEGLTAELHFPLPEGPVELGRLLITDMVGHKLLEYDAQGNKIWEKTLPLTNLWACQGLSNGHRLVSSLQERKIVELDEKGDEVWQFKDLPGGAMSVQRLENGNTLIACPDVNQVLEITPEKKIVWTAATGNRPTSARRLENGNTLVSLQMENRVVEIDTLGKVVWDLKAGGMVFSAERLPNGNTLLVDFNSAEVREYDRENKMVWSRGGFPQPYCAQRLSSGNTLVVSRTGVSELDPKGTVVRNLPMMNCYQAHRY